MKSNKGMLFMLPSDRLGEGSYKMEEFVETGDAIEPTSSFEGRYSTLYAEVPEQRVIHFHNSAHPRGCERTYATSGFRSSITGSKLRMIRTEMFRKSDLTVVMSRKFKLIILDSPQNAMTVDRDLTLSGASRTCFTTEGYFRHTGDSADFFEMNTRVTWAFSKYGDYQKAIRQYHQLTTRKFEAMYLKAVAFSIDHLKKDGPEVEALVIRNVLQMTTAHTGED